MKIYILIVINKYCWGIGQVKLTNLKIKFDN